MIERKYGRRIALESIFGAGGAVLLAGCSQAPTTEMSKREIPEVYVPAVEGITSARTVGAPHSELARFVDYMRPLTAALLSRGDALHFQNQELYRIFTIFKDGYVPCVASLEISPSETVMRSLFLDGRILNGVAMTEAISTTTPGRNYSARGRVLSSVELERFIPIVDGGGEIDPIIQRAMVHSFSRGGRYDEEMATKIRVFCQKASFEEIPAA